MVIKWERLYLLSYILDTIGYTCTKLVTNTTLRNSLLLLSHRALSCRFSRAQAEPYQNY